MFGAESHMAEEEPPKPQFLYAEEAKKYGIPMHSDAEGVELHGFTVASQPPQFAPFRPILDRILIKRVEPEETVDGFQVPSKYRQHSNLGEVIAIGDGIVLGHEWHPLSEFIAVGDRCMYGEYTSELWQHDGEELWIVRLQDVRGVERRK